MFTAEEKRNLTAFCKVVDSLNACRFVSELGEQSHHICVGKLPDGTIVDVWPRYDDDDFRAMMTHYRKLRMQGENTHLNRIINLLKRENDDATREQLDHLLHEISEEGAGWWGPMLAAADGQQILLTQAEVENLILNGEVFHTDHNKAEELRKAIGSGSLMKAIAFCNYMRFWRTVNWAASETAKLIRERGYLD